MKELFQLDDYKEEDSFSILGFITKYLGYWRWFLVSIIVCLFLGFLYMRYSPTIYWTSAKIKIIDENQESDITSTVAQSMWNVSSVNLENEIEVIKSYRLLDQVVAALNLDVSYYYVGTFKTSEIWNPPFLVTKFISSDSLKQHKAYDIELQNSQFAITDHGDDQFIVGFDSENNSAPGLPFSIELPENTEVQNLEHVRYKVILSPRKAATMKLEQRLQVYPTNKKSDILALSLTGESIQRSEAIINAIIEIFNQDGIEDKQAMSKRTLDFIDERFIYLTSELDSIELGKQDFKQDNTLAYIEDDATTILKRKSETESEVFDLETQLSLSRLLRAAVVNETNYGLLPPEIGIQNSSINALVSNYNELSRERSKLMASAGASHPSVQPLTDQLNRARENILKTIDVNQRQLSASLANLSRERARAGEMFSRIPEKEKMLRAIERQQSIKENLFLLLLSKREQAAINNAVTAPVIKVVDYAQTAAQPLAPKKIMVYPIAVILGLSLPFFILFMRFTLDKKIYGRADVEQVNPDIPILGEIPFIKNQNGFLMTDDRSLLAESFRILCTNIIHTTPATTKGKVIFVTSSIKGEGKTSTTINLAIALAGLNRRILIVDGDLRNPQFVKHFNMESNTLGFSDFITNPEMDWKNCIYKNKNVTQPLYICPSGTQKTSPPELLASENVELFINKSKEEFDYIIVDTAPTLLISDTFLISNFADISLFILRANFSNKNLLEFSKDLYKSRKLINMGYVINAVELGAMKNLNYGYGYGYDTDADQS